MRFFFTYAQYASMNAGLRVLSTPYDYTQVEKTQHWKSTLNWNMQSNRHIPISLIYKVTARVGRREYMDGS